VKKRKKMIRAYLKKKAIREKMPKRPKMERIIKRKVLIMFKTIHPKENQILSKSSQMLKLRSLMEKQKNKSQ